MYIKEKETKGLSPIFLSFLCAVFFTLLINIPFWRALNNIFLENSNQLGNTIFINYIGFPLFLFFLLWFFFFVLTIPYITKIIYSVLIVVSAAGFYSSFQYGVYYDDVIIKSIFETKPKEAKDIVTTSFLFCIFILGLIPSFFILRVKINYGGLFFFIKRYLLAGVSLLFITLLLLTFITKPLASIRKNHQEIRYLLSPYQYIYGGYKYFSENILRKDIPFRNIALDAKSNVRSSKEKPLVVFFILGETARSDHYSLNGYDRKTNQYTEEYSNLYSFKAFTSCGTATVTSLPCMFSRYDRKGFKINLAKSEDNVFDILQRAGIAQFFKENNTDCKGVCDRINTLYFKSYGSDYSLCDRGISNNKRCIIPNWPSKIDNLDNFCDKNNCFDEVLTNRLYDEAMFYAFHAVKNKGHNLKAGDEFQSSTGNLSRLVTGDLLVTLHILGSHGPAYHERYPSRFKKYQPECLTSSIENCSDEEIINSYDNTILYTDYIMSRVIETAKKMEDHYNTAVIYVSDHGESLGEFGLYLHGLPYRIAPKAQKEVPFILWFSDGFISTEGLNAKCISKKARGDDETYSHNNIFHTLLGLFSVNSSVYKEDLDIISECLEYSR